MNDDQLQKLTEELSLRDFDKPFMHKAYFNKRLRTTGGRYMLHSHHIEINPRYYDQFGENELVGIIKHELCHYHLHIEGKGYKHRDKDFRILLQKVDAPRFCSVLPENNKRKIQTLYYYECSICHTLYVRKRNVDLKRYACGKCRGKLKKVRSGK
ncbi:SprT family protein [Bacillus sp. 1P06AnD]|uniref:SprT family protein n=1 Tax=Bacillus sp. 1P06AnD TaxID=3132208 RepID=UPI0039A1559D